MPDAHCESKTRRAYFIKKRQYFSYERSDKQYISRRGACEKPERNRPETPYQSGKKQVYPRRRRDRRFVPQRIHRENRRRPYENTDVDVRRRHDEKRQILPARKKRKGKQTENLSSYYYLLVCQQIVIQTLPKRRYFNAFMKNARL